MQHGCALAFAKLRHQHMASVGKFDRVMVAIGHFGFDTAYCNRLHEFCAQRNIVHMTIKSDTPIDSFVMDYLRRRGLLK